MLKLTGKKILNLNLSMLSHLQSCIRTTIDSTTVSLAGFLYPATLKSGGYSVLPSIQKKIAFKCPSVRLYVPPAVRQRIILTRYWEHFLTNFLQTC